MKTDKCRKGNTKNKRHRMLHCLFSLIAIMTMAVVFVALPMRTYAVNYGDDVENLTIDDARERSDIQPEIYDDLGLTISNELPEGKAAPLSDSNAFSLIDKREVYISANGSKANKYIVRNGLNILGPTSGSNQGDKDMKSDSGASWGAYKLWDINKNNMFEKHGNTRDSFLSNNDSDNVMKIDKADFDGKYATSVAFIAKAGKDSKKDHVAELRGYHANCSQKYRGNDEWYKGLIKIAIFSFDEDGTRHEETTILPTLHKSQFLDRDGYKELNYLDLGYLQEYDAYFEIEAADVDDDGIDEIFAYTGAYEDKDDGHRYAIVYMIKTNDGKNWNYSMVYADTGPASNYQTIDDLKKENSKHWRRMVARLAPVVTLASCDLDRNGAEEIAITTSAPVGHKDAAAASRARVFHWDKQAKNVVTVEGLDDIPLSSSNGKALTSANCASGVFLYTLPAYRYAINTLIFAGWETNDKTTNCKEAWKNFGYRYLYYNPDTRSYEISEYSTHELGKDAKIIADSAAKKITGDNRYMATMAPFALDCANLETLSNDMSSDYVLAGGDIYHFNLVDNADTKAKAGLGVSVGSISLFSGQYHHQSGVSEINKPKDHIWIGDVVSGCVTTSGLGSVNESFLAVIGVRRDDDVRGSDDYYWLDVAHFTFEKGSSALRCTGQEGVINESTRMGNITGPNLSLALPDIDDDSVRAYMVGQAILPTVPEVLTVLQDTPYFGDLQEVYNYLSNSHTTFSSGHEEDIGNGFYIHFGAGGRFYGEWDTVVNFQLDISGKRSASYDRQWHNSHGNYISYSAVGGKGDKVVMYAVPYIYTYYKVYNPLTKTWEDSMQTEALDPVTSVVSIEAWDEIAQKTDTLPLIGVDPEDLGTVIGSTSGDPSTYTSENLGGGDKKYCESTNTTSVSTNMGEGSNVELKATTGKSYDWNLNLGPEINVTTGFGGGLLGNKIGVGFVADFSAGYERSVVQTYTSEFSGAVDNLPILKGVSGNNDKYSFQCKLRVNKLEYSEEEKKKYKKENKRKLDDVYIIGYIVDQKSLTQPQLRMVPDTRVDDITSDSVNLSWEPMDFGNDGDGDEKKKPYYRVGLLASDGSGKVSDWYYIKADAHPKPDANGRIDRIKYTMPDLKAGTKYQFVVQAVRGKYEENKDGSSFTVASSSIPSAELTAVTLDKGESIKLLTNPKALNVLKPGENAEYTVSAQWTRNDKDNSRNISYAWEYWDAKDGIWCEYGDGHGDSIIEVEPDYKEDTKAGAENNGSSESKLIIKNVSAEQDGTSIRCRLGFGGQVIYSSSVLLRVETPLESPHVSSQVSTLTTQTSIKDAVWFEPAEEGEGRYGSADDNENENKEQEPDNRDDEEEKKEDEKKDNNKKTVVKKTVVKKKASPDTGDNNSPVLWIITGSVAAGLLITAGVVARRARRK